MKLFQSLAVSLWILFAPSFTYANPVSNADKVASFCKVWGFLKYFHPAVAKGKINWDQEFITRIKSLDSLHSKEELSIFYIHWIDQLGKLEVCNTCSAHLNDTFSLNFDLNWLTDQYLFTDDLIGRLKFIEKNRNQGKNYYVQQLPAGHTSYKHEKHYHDSVFPSVELRLLSLSRYWNSVNYFYPYKYKTDQKWDNVLTEMIPTFIQCTDTISYHLAMMELVAKLNDSHAGLNTKYTSEYFGYQRPPFMFRIIDNKIIVTGFYNDSLCMADDIQYGDIFTAIDQKSIEEIIHEKSKYIGASNHAAMIRKMHSVIFNGQSPVINVTYERNGVIHTKNIHRYSSKDLNHEPKPNKQVSWKILEGNIGYVNVGRLKQKQVHQMIKEVKGTKALIFDVRGYPNFRYREVTRFLNKEKKPFAKFIAPDLSYPGIFKETHVSSCGTNNPDYYKGTVIILFNEFTQSGAEFIVMALQTAPKVISIGSQTSGADGNVSLLTFPGGYETFISGLGIYYPDGRETQRIGIVPDIEVKPTINGILSRKDEVLEKALEIGRMQE